MCGSSQQELGIFRLDGSKAGRRRRFRRVGGHRLNQLHRLVISLEDQRPSQRSPEARHNAQKTARDDHFQVNTVAGREAEKRTQRLHAAAEEIAQVTISTRLGDWEVTVPEQAVTDGLS
jgi:hypothetical protein